MVAVGGPLQAQRGLSARRAPRQGRARCRMRHGTPGGKISITLYAAYNRIYVASSDLWRKVTTRLSPKIVYYMSHLAIPIYHLYRIPVVGNIGKALWPISLHPDPEWRLLDT